MAAKEKVTPDPSPCPLPEGEGSLRLRRRLKTSALSGAAGSRSASLLEAGAPQFVVAPSTAGCPKEWSIAIYGGTSLGALSSQRGDDPPALTFRDVDDLPARFVADPFLVRHNDEWLLFFEVLNASREKGEIALARSSDAVDWKYDGTVLREPFHLSYPNVFAADGEWWMTPEAVDADGILLYRADEFPRRWSLDRVLLEGTWADPTVFAYDGGWWMFACATPYQHDRLELFWADDVRGPWHRHPRSPIVTGDPRRARPAGRPRVIDGAHTRFAQDCRPDYGNAVRAFAISKLTRDEYEERELPSPVVTASGAGWNADGMHTVDLHRWEGRWIAAVDGYRYRSKPQYELVTTLDQFDALSSEWEELLQRSSAHAVFSAHAWIRAALICSPERAPHVATLRIDGRLEAILPFVRTAGGIEFATFLSDYNDFIASSRLHAARAFHSMLRMLPTGTHVVMRGLREESDALAVARACTPHARVSPETTCLFADVSESFFRTRSHSLRKALGRARARADAESVTCSPLCAALDSVEGLSPETIVEVFLALNRERFGGSSRFAGADSEAFVREALPPLLRSGAIQPFAVVRGADVLAIDLVLVTRDAVAPWNGGFTAEAAALSPGVGSSRVDLQACKLEYSIVSPK